MIIICVWLLFIPSENGKFLCPTTRKSAITTMIIVIGIIIKKGNFVYSHCGNQSVAACRRSVSSCHRHLAADTPTNFLSFLQQCRSLVVSVTASHQIGPGSNPTWAMQLIDLIFIANFTSFFFVGCCYQASIVMKSIGSNVANTIG